MTLFDFRSGILLIILILLLTLPFSAQYRFDSWTTNNGLPQNSVRAIVRTRDGYLWLGTFEGLTRFDGVNFTVFDNVNTPEFKSNFVRSLLEDREGNLWIGIDGGGIVKYSGHQFTYYSTADGLSSNNVTCLFEDSEGRLWAGTDDAGINVFGDGKFAKFNAGNGLLEKNIYSLVEDDGGVVWVGSSNGLVGLKDGKVISVYQQHDGLWGNDVTALLWNRTDGLWIGTRNGINLLQNGKLSSIRGANGSILAIYSLSEDREKNLWIGTEAQGLFRFNRADMTSPALVGDVPDEAIAAIYTDLEDNLWVGSMSRGLSRFRYRRFHPLAVPGVVNENAHAVYEDSGGTLWFSADNKINRLKYGVLTVYDAQTSMLSNINAIAEDNEGTIWFGGGGGVSRFKDDRFTRLPAEALPGGVLTLTVDHQNNVWIGTSRGLSVWRDGRVTKYTTAEGLVDNFIISLFSDRSGAVWIGTRNGLSRFKDGAFTNWTTADGLAANHILSFYEDASGALWIGTSGGGLNRFKEGKFKTITSRDGLFDNLAFQILEDASGNLWMCGNKGVYRTRIEELNDFADGLRPSVSSYSYDTADGMLNRECNGSSPGGWKARDGTIWFPTVKGLIAVDTNQEESPPPKVIIEQIRLDGNFLEPKAHFEINPGQENLEINYTGISWQRPLHIRFRYKLEGLDSDWVDAGTRRTAFYPHLPPGDYTFRVIADNGDGAWNLEGQSLKITVLPPFYRTWWFIGLVLLLFGGVALTLYRRRINQLEKARFAQEQFSRRLINAHESERHRIAAELHDGLGQSLAMIKNTAVFGREVSKDLEIARTQLDKISVQSAQAVAEVREIAYNLRPYLLDRLGLTKAIKSLTNKVADTKAFDLTANVDEIDGLFGKDEEMSIYRIIQECLNNILKHADADEVSVAVERHGKAVTIRIKDDGRGFDVTPAEDVMKKRGFGLLGISERVRMLGGNYSVQSEIGKGTTITINVETQTLGEIV